MVYQGSVQGLTIHWERKTENHANKDIDNERSHLKDFVLNDTFDNVLKELEALGETVVTERGEGKGSTDAGNISYEVPTVHGYIKIGPDDLIGHTIEFREAAKSERGNEALLVGAKALARTAHRLLTDQQLLDDIKNEFKRRIEEKSK